MPVGLGWVGFFEAVQGVPGAGVAIAHPPQVTLGAVVVGAVQRAGVGLVLIIDVLACRADLFEQQPFGDAWRFLGGGLGVGLRLGFRFGNARRFGFAVAVHMAVAALDAPERCLAVGGDRKSTRLNSSH